MLTKKGVNAVANRWHQLVQEYSGLRMTFQKDALPALSGLARQMSEHREGQQYSAGMWDYTIFMDMLWATEESAINNDNNNNNNNRGARRRPDKWRGPSWSWISTTTRVTYLQASVYAIVHLYPQIVDSNIRVMASDRFGQVMRPTWLKIKSTLFSGGTLQFAAQRQNQNQGKDDSNNTKKQEEEEVTQTDYSIHIKGGEYLGVFKPDYDFSAVATNGGGSLLRGPCLMDTALIWF